MTRSEADQTFWTITARTARAAAGMYFEPLRLVWSRRREWKKYFWGVWQAVAMTAMVIALVSHLEKYEHQGKRIPVGWALFLTMCGGLIAIYSDVLLERARGWRHQLERRQDQTLLRKRELDL